MFRDGIKLKLGGQPFQVLVYLLSRPGEVVTREELQTALWQADTFVDFDHGLNTAINKIREALGDSASNPRFVETVPRRGYRFIAPVGRPVQAPADPPEAPRLAPPPPAPPPTPSRNWIPLAAGAAVVAVAAAVGLSAFRSRPSAPIDYQLTQITRDSGLTQQPSISADGNFVVYASDRATGKDLDIWIQHASGGQPVRLTSTLTNESYPSLSADGRRVAFQVGRSRDDSGIAVIPALGGTPKLVAAFGLYPQISPDGASVAYSSGTILQASEVRVVSTDGGEPRAVKTDRDWAIAPIWTPDGRGLFTWTRAPLDFWNVPVSGGVASKTGVAERFRELAGVPMLFLPFLRDPYPVASVATGGIVIAVRSGDGHDLWFFPLSGGRSAGVPVRITVGAGAAHPSIAANGRIAFSRLSVSSGLWILPIDPSSGRAPGSLRRAWTENVTVAYPNVSTDGKRLVYVSNRGGDPDVWIRDLATGADRQLTASKEHEFRAVISPNGERVAFALRGDASKSQKGSAYIMPAAGGVQKLICANCMNHVVGWTPDGASLIYYEGSPIRHGVYDLATGRKRDLAWHPTGHIHNLRFSRDGRWITFTLVAEASRVIYVAAVDNGGKPESWKRVSGEGPADSSFWSPDGNLIYIHQEDALWARKLDPWTKAPVGDAFLVQRLNGPRFSAIFSVNGLTKDALYFTMDEMTSNIWLADPAGR